MDVKPRVRWWVWLMPDVFVVLPLTAAIFGGAGAAVLLRTEPIALGSFALLAWLTYLVLGVRFVTRRRYASLGFALCVALIGVTIATCVYAFY